VQVALRFSRQELYNTSSVDKASSITEWVRLPRLGNESQL